jgi:tetratricopeptide (TPR) repeat protein
MGRAAEAIASVRLAQELDPLSLIIGAALARVFHFARQYDRAREQCLKTLEMDLLFAEAQMNLALVYVQQSLFTEAVDRLRRAMAMAGRRPLMQAILGYVFGLAGDRDEARRTLDELDGLAGEGRIPTLYLVYPCIGLGETERAFDLLETAYRERSGLLVFLKVEPIFDSLRSDARFEDLLRRMGLSGAMLGP